MRPSWLPKTWSGELPDLRELSLRPYSVWGACFPDTVDVWPSIGCEGYRTPEPLRHTACA